MSFWQQQDSYREGPDVQKMQSSLLLTLLYCLDKA